MLIKITLKTALLAKLVSTVKTAVTTMINTRGDKLPKSGDTVPTKKGVMPVASFVKRLDSGRTIANKIATSQDTPLAII